MAEPRVGLGFDVHRRAPDRPLVLGGVRFEGEPGLAAHSDGDVACHALADALLGAAGLGDLGVHFPDTDPTTVGLGGLDLLGRAVALVRGAGFRPASCDLTVLAERPALSPRREAISANISGAMGLPADRVSVKATRPEGLGLTGDGIGCLAVAVV
ncbi:MAG: 2-C-methyl-D-erythritol 2,4-cyclodiphosphate synthase, partial [Actinomycetota bacterium]|nr:2-C-methyl-D-erythritol 2,4-cyclodiphosphate synthase [Actinomycetota bacterium]